MEHSAIRAIKQDKVQETKEKRRLNNLKKMRKEIYGIPTELKEEDVIFKKLKRGKQCCFPRKQLGGKFEGKDYIRKRDIEK